MKRQPREAKSIVAYLLEQVARKNITPDEAVKLLEAATEYEEARARSNSRRNDGDRLS